LTFFEKMFQVLAILFVAVSPLTAKPKKPSWTEYQLSFYGTKPVMVLKWLSMDTAGSFTECPDAWAVGKRIGHGGRLRVVSISRAEAPKDSKAPGVVTAVIEDTSTKKQFTFRSDKLRIERSYSEEWVSQWRKKWSENPNANEESSNAEQGSAGQPATRSESDSEGSDKPQPESEGRSR
jgi:hypothetical protein